MDSEGKYEEEEKLLFNWKNLEERIRKKNLLNLMKIKEFKLCETFSNLEMKKKK